MSLSVRSWKLSYCEARAFIHLPRDVSSPKDCYNLRDITSWALSQRYSKRANASDEPRRTETNLFQFKFGGKDLLFRCTTRRTFSRTSYCTFTRKPDRRKVTSPPRLVALRSAASVTDPTPLSEYNRVG